MVSMPNSMISTMSKQEFVKTQSWLIDKLCWHIQMFGLAEKMAESDIEWNKNLIELHEKQITTGTFKKFPIDLHMGGVKCHV